MNLIIRCSTEISFWLNAFFSHFIPSRTAEVQEIKARKLMAEIGAHSSNINMPANFQVLFHVIQDEVPFLKDPATQGHLHAHWKL